MWFKRKHTPQSTPNPIPESLRSGLEALVQDNNNVLHALYRELEFWTGQVSDPKICNVYERISNDPDSISGCSPELIKIVDKLLAEGIRPRILDLGAGPFSLMYYFKRTNKADAVAVDILAREYREMLNRFKFHDIVMPEFGTGEFLDVQQHGEKFDIVYIGNALDHTSSPALSWLNAIRMTKIGGVIGHAHFVREGSAQKQDQLHQFDLYPEEDQLWLDDLKGHRFSLTRGLPLRLIHRDEYLVNSDMPAFAQLFVKTGEDFETPEFLGHVIEDLRRALQRRSQWAFRLEHFVNTTAGLGTASVPYSLDPDKA
jgi:SAM-dependent methyltransferase